MSDDWKQFSKLALDYYNSLPKSGKPSKDEWTTLAAIIEVHQTSYTPRVVSLATGTKCVTGKPARVNANVVIDCHAESLCRRAFKRYIIDQTKNGKSTDGHKYFMLISQLPCGVLDRYQGSSEEDCILKKPGRDEKCFKPSCVFKISKWISDGLQGKSLIDVSGIRINLEGLVIGNCTEKLEVTDDLLIKMNHLIEDCQKILNTKSDSNSIKKMKVDVKNVSIFFDTNFKVDTFTKNNSKRACFTSIVSWASFQGVVITEVIVQGRKQGSTGKSSKNSQLLVSSSMLKNDLETLKVITKV